MTEAERILENCGVYHVCAPDRLREFENGLEQRFVEFGADDTLAALILELRQRLSKRIISLEVMLRPTKIKTKESRL